jgi:hypothetical protein
VLSIAAPPQRFLAAASILLKGADAPWLAAAGYHRDDLVAFDVLAASQLVLDGELYEAGEFCVRQGPELEFVVP